MQPAFIFILNKGEQWATLKTESCLLSTGRIRGMLTSSLAESGRRVLGPSLQLKNRAYETDGHDFLENPFTWDESFAEEMADRVNISGGLTAAHWGVIYFIRNTYMETGRCPAVYETLRNLNLRIQDLKNSFQQVIFGEHANWQG